MKKLDLIVVQELKRQKKKQNKKDTLENLNALDTERQKSVDVVQSGIFFINKTEGTGFSDHRQY